MSEVVIVIGKFSKYRPRMNNLQFWLLSRSLSSMKLSVSLWWQQMMYRQFTESVIFIARQHTAADARY